MKRYFFSNTTSDGENANVFIDATDPQTAINHYHQWSAEVLGTIQSTFQMWLLPDISKTSHALDWYEEVLRFN